MLDDFAVFILTHGRPDNVITYKALQKGGYTGPVYIVIDNEDKTADKYRKNFGEKVITFDKAAIAETFDEGDNFNDRRAVIYARNACFEIARKSGIKFFLELDDDYTDFRYRINGRGEHPSDHFTIKSCLNQVFRSFLCYYQSINVASIAMAQGGDFFSGADAFGKAKRKCMNTFFCSTERSFAFVGRVNEDVNTYVWRQSIGAVFITVPFVMINQITTQAGAGGMTEMYLDSGTYSKSFYTVMYAPSCVHVSMMGSRHRRLHHQIEWDAAVPYIVPQSCRKADAAVS